MKKSNVLLVLVGFAVGFRVLAQEIPSYKASSTAKIVGAFDLAENCQVLNESFKTCSWKGSHSIANNIAVSEQMRRSIASVVQINGSFQDTTGQFSVKIDNQIFAIADVNGIQSFKIPQDGEGVLSITLISNYEGQGDVAKSYQSNIKSISIVQDNAAVLSDVLTGSLELASKGKDQLQNYKLQKKLAKFIDLSDASLKDLKEVLTGRAPDDMSDDCLVNGAGAAHALDPEQCQILHHIDKLLKNEPTDVTQATVDAALEVVKGTVAKLEKAKLYLEAAQTDLNKNFQDKIAAIKDFLTQASLTNT